MQKKEQNTLVEVKLAIKCYQNVFFQGVIVSKLSW